MKVREIIAAAPPGPWAVEPRVEYWTVVSDFHPPGNALQAKTVCKVPPTVVREGASDFIGTFDPEHVALMEAVLDCIDETGSVYLADMHRAWESLLAYRRDKGLE